MASSPPSYRACGSSYNPIPPPYDYRFTSSPVSEHTTLIRSSTNRKGERPLSYDALFIICLVLLLVPLSALFGFWIDRSSYENTLDPDVRDRIRHKWDIEARAHERLMKHAREQESQLREKLDEWNQKNDEWRRKEQNWEREWNEMMRRKHEETERVEREKRERERMNLYWEDIRGGDHCIAHKTMEYTARLANLGPGTDALDACRATSLTIHGVTYNTPTHCEDRRDFGDGIRGHWTDNEAPMCSTFWLYFKYKGCLAPGSGLQRVETPLGNLRSGDNPDDMCYSTPAVIGGRSYNGPNAGCVDWGKYGHWGIWDIPDNGCY